MKWFAFLLQGALIACLVWLVFRLVPGLRRIAPKLEASLEDEAINAENFRERLPVVLEKHGLSPEAWQQYLRLQKTGTRLGLEPEINLAAERFNLDPDWLVKKSGDVYPMRSPYNSPNSAKAFIDTLSAADKAEVWVFKPQGVSLSTQVYEAFLLLVAVTYEVLGGQPYQRFIPVHVYWEWGFPPTRQQCLALLHQAKTNRIRLHGFDLVAADLYKILDNQFLLQDFLNTADLSQWDPEEYVIEESTDLANGLEQLFPDLVINEDS